MTGWRDAHGYLCTDPPQHMRIDRQHKRYPDKGNEGPRLTDAELQATLNYVVRDGHNTVEAAEHFHLHPSSVCSRLRNAGYSYDAGTNSWGVG